MNKIISKKSYILKMENFNDCYKNSMRHVRNESVAISNNSLEFSQLINSQVLQDLQANIKIFAQVPYLYPNNFD